MNWPQTMRKATAARYLDMSEAAFVREVAAGRMPASFMIGGREHWRRDAIDKALDLLTGEGVDQAEREFWNRGKAA